MPAWTITFDFDCETTAAVYTLADGETGKGQHGEVFPDTTTRVRRSADKVFADVGVDSFPSAIEVSIAYDGETLASERFVLRKGTHVAYATGRLTRVGEPTVELGLDTRNMTFPWEQQP